MTPKEKEDATFVSNKELIWPNKIEKGKIMYCEI